MPDDSAKKPAAPRTAARTGVSPFSPTPPSSSGNTPKTPPIAPRAAMIGTGPASATSDAISRAGVAAGATPSIDKLPPEIRDEVRALVRIAVEEAVAPLLRTLQEINRENARRSYPDLTSRIANARPSSMPPPLRPSAPPPAEVVNEAGVPGIAPGTLDPNLPIPAPVPPPPFAPALSMLPPTSMDPGPMGAVSQAPEQPMQIAPSYAPPVRVSSVPPVTQTPLDPPGQAQVQAPISMSVAPYTATAPIASPVPAASPIAASTLLAPTAAALAPAPVPAIATTAVSAGVGSPSPPRVAPVPAPPPSAPRAAPPLPPRAQSSPQIGVAAPLHAPIARPASMPPPGATLVRLSFPPAPPLSMAESEPFRAPMPSAYDTYTPMGTAGIDLPSELDGSKRKKRLGLGIAFVIVVMMAGLIGASATSYSGH